MRILIVNKFYYSRGGDCVVAMTLEQMLKAHGHEVAVYAMHYAENEKSAWSEYFAPTVDMGSGLSGKIAAVARVLGYGDIRKSAERVLDEFRPDVVHMHNVHSYLSPLIAQLAHKRGIRVVWTMHDYKLVCPAYTCRRGDSACEECLGGGKAGVLKHRCMKGSAVASAVAWIESLRWNRRVLQKCTDAFVCPSKFMASKLIADGFASEKVCTVCNFVDPNKIAKFTPERVSQPREPYFCYVGRLSREKGVATLVEAFAQMPEMRLKVAGGGPLEAELRAKYVGCGNVEFLGMLDAAHVADLLLGASASVMPSECYENNPLGVIESLCAGTPVVGANIGGIPELIESTCGGVTFESGSVESLKSAVAECAAKSWDNATLSAMASEAFSQGTHYSKLLTLYCGAG